MTLKRRFEKMYTAYADELFRYTLVYVKDRELAEDLTSEAFVRAWKHLPTFNDEQPRAWLYSIVRNLMKDHWRKAHAELLDEETEIVDERQNVERHVEAVLTKDRINTALATLAEPMRSVVYFRFIEDRSAKDVAQSLGLTEANVRVLQFRALKKLKAVLK